MFHLIGDMSGTKTPKPAGPWRDSPERYGLVSRALHWGMAYLLIWQFLSILAWKIFGPVDWVKTVTSFGPSHGIVGLLVLPLVVIRALWALANRANRPAYDGQRAGRLAAVGHGSFYVLMFVIPALGLIRTYANGKGWNPWDLPLIPATGQEIGWLVAAINALHSPLSWLLSVLIIGHIVMAMVHRFLHRDGILARMTGPLR